MSFVPAIANTPETLPRPFAQRTPFAFELGLTRASQRTALCTAAEPPPQPAASSDATVATSARLEHERVRIGLLPGGIIFGQASLHDRAR